MRVALLKIIILLTTLVGFILPAAAQVEPNDTVPTVVNDAKVKDSLIIGEDSSAIARRADIENKITRSTDSVYTTPVALSSDMIPAEVTYTASDSIVADVNKGLAFLYKDAIVTYNDLSIKAGFISINFETNEVFASGIEDSSGALIQKPVFTENGKSYQSTEMRYNFDSKKAKIKKVITKEGEGYLHGQNVKKVSDEVFYVKNASYTTCSHEDPHFKIISPKAKMISGAKIVTKFAFLEVLEIPTPLLVPFGFFPTTQTRKSGVIIPSYGNNLYRGYFLKDGGYYFAISDYVDLTLLANIYSQGGYGITGASSYAKRYKYNGNLSMSYNVIKFGLEEFAGFAPEYYSDNSDFAVTWSHNQDAKARPDFRFNASVNIASSNYYKVTSTDAEDVLQNRLNSSVSINKTWTGRPFNLSASVNHSQNNQTNDLTVTLPNLSFGVNRQFPFKRKVRVGPKKWYEEIGYSYNLVGKNEITSKLNQPFFTESVFTDSARSGLKHSIPISANYKVFKHFVLSPSVSYNERWYFKRYERASGFDTVNGKPVYRVSVVDTTSGFYQVRDFSTSAALSTKLYGMWRFKGGLKALRHVATPSVSFNYHPAYSGSKWDYYQTLPTDTNGNTQHYSRYTGSLYGTPGADKQGSIGFNLQNTLEAKVKSKKDSTGLNKVRLLEGLGLSTAYNMAAKEFKWSQLGLSARSSVFSGLISITYNSSFDFYGYDSSLDSNGNVIGRVNESALKVNNKLMRFTSQRFSLGLNLSPDRFGKNKKKTPAPTEKRNLGEGDPQNSPLGITPGDINYYNENRYIDFNLPWNASINYYLNKSYRGTTSTITQSVDASGDVELTENWRVGMSTGYDLVAKEFTYTSFDIYRNLHCWELRCSWIPMGLQQSYVLTIRVKAAALSDLKLTHQRGIGDYTR